MSALTCPCCGQAVAAASDIRALEVARAGSKTQRLIDRLVMKYPKGATNDELVELIYSSEPDGGPDYAKESVVVMLHHARDKLLRHGWTVTRAFRGGEYRLMKVTSVRAA